MNKNRYTLTTGVLILVALGVVLYWLLHDRFYESTDNAYVGGNKLMITSQVSGIVTQIGAEDASLVEVGHLLVGLDPTDHRIALNLEKEKLATICRDVVQLFESVEEKTADLASKEVRFHQSESDYRHRQLLISVGGVAREELEQSETTMKEDEALLALASAKLEAALAQVQNTTPSTHPKVLEAIESLKKAYVELSRCSIAAPQAGVIAQRSAQVGKWVDPKDALMAIIPLHQMWVDVNFREVQMKKIRIGQPVELTSDYYGYAVKYHGTVVGIGAGTGTVFSLLPAQNATGNWVKIIQRVPVRVQLDPQELAEHPLRLGLSMKARVNLRNQHGGIIPAPSKSENLYSTAIYENQDQGVEEEIAAILEQNIPPRYRCPE
jgi:membrane fusion protein (multidrug efflux system)